MLLAGNTTSSNKGNSDIQICNFSTLLNQTCILNRLVMTTIFSTISMVIISQLKVT